MNIDLLLSCPACGAPVSPTTSSARPAGRPSPPSRGRGAPPPRGRPRLGGGRCHRPRASCIAATRTRSTCEADRRVRRCSWCATGCPHRPAPDRGRAGRREELGRAIEEAPATSAPRSRTVPGTRPVSSRDAVARGGRRPSSPCRGRTTRSRDAPSCTIVAGAVGRRDTHRRAGSATAGPTGSTRLAAGSSRSTTRGPRSRSGSGRLSRELAEADGRAHAITRWLGADADPRTPARSRPCARRRPAACSCARTGSGTTCRRRTSSAGSSSPRTPQHRWRWRGPWSATPCPAAGTTT